MQTPTSRWRAMVVRGLVPVYLMLIAGAPAALVVALARAARTPLRFYAAVGLSPAIYVVTYVVVAGVLSRLTLRWITPGRYPRDLGHRIYGPRRLYALGWTAIYYWAPLYHAILAVPALKRLTFRLFGYRGSLDFQTYPDTWLRDLPLLSVGKGAYLSNKATVSPNMCLRSGKVIVLPVSIGAGTMIGHLTMIAPGVDIGPHCEIGVGAAVGINVSVGAHTVVDAETVVDHDAAIGDRCVIGTRSYIGRKAVIRSGIRVPPASVVPARAVLTTQADADALAQRASSRPTARSFTQLAISANDA